MKSFLSLASLIIALFASKLQVGAATLVWTKETLNKDEFRNFGGYWFLMTLQRPEKLCFAA